MLSCINADSHYFHGDLAGVCFYLREKGRKPQADLIHVHAVPQRTGGNSVHFQVEDSKVTKKQILISSNKIRSEYCWAEQKHLF